MRPHAHEFDKKSFTPFIKYTPELKRFFGSSESVLIFQKSEYWSSKYPNGFWKFHEPCTRHTQYRKGDSWSEELGFSRRVFLRAFSVFGVHYKSKSAYLKEVDPFQGKMYVSYYDRKTNRTYFLRNHSFVEKFLKSFWEGTKKLTKLIKEKVQNCRSRNDQDGRSFTCANNISLQRSTSSQELAEPEFLKPQSLPPEPEGIEEQDKNIKVAQEMLEIWNKITGNRHPLRSDLKISLPQALRDSFEGSLELWTDFCLSVASSKFLMGEAPNSKFKAHLAWLIKPQTVQAIREKYYSLGDREVAHFPRSSKPEPQFSRCDIQGSDHWKEICEHLSHRLGYATFRSWFRDVKFLREETTKPILHCPTRFIGNWIQSRYQSDLEGIVRQLLPHTTHLEIRSEL